MNVLVYGYRYKVWDTDDPDKHRFLVTKDRRCSCGLVKCEHVQAVSEYLKRGGRKAPNEERDTRPTLEERIARIRMLRELAIKNGTLGAGAMAILSASKVSNNTQAVEWYKMYAHHSQWPVEMRK